jgi:leucyl aminopeptidase
MYNIFTQDSPNKQDLITICLCSDKEEVAQKLKLSDIEWQWVEEHHHPLQDGGIYQKPYDHRIYVVLSDPKNPEAWAECYHILPKKSYELPDDISDDIYHSAIMAFGLSQYHFSLKTDIEKSDALRLYVTERPEYQKIIAYIQATIRARSLINSPANIMTPFALTQEVKKLAEQYDAAFILHDFLQRDFPMVKIVGQASSNLPYVCELNWGDNPEFPLVVLIGKGVCFDTGGLDIKPSSNMLMMKKDMGGAANMIALSQMMMAEHLPIRLKLIIPTAENSISGNAYRASDVITAGNGKTVEIGNTDAEGRLLLADALSYACRFQPDFIIDYATLTGAARVALGTDLPAIFTNDDVIWQLLEQNQQSYDPVWRLPLHEAYRSKIKSKIADIHSTGSGGYGGAITAALFLEYFVDHHISWLHGDVMSYRLHDSALFPEGGDIQGVHSLFSMLKEKYK